MISGLKHLMTDYYKMHTAILILSCDKEKYKVVRERLWENSIQHLSKLVSVFYLFGKTDTVPTVPLGTTRIVAPCNDNYEDISYKVYYGLKYLYYLGFDTVVKLDDNVRITNAVQFMEIINSEALKHDYLALRGIGHYGLKSDNTQAMLSFCHFGKVSDPRLNYMPAILPLNPYARGPGYCLNHKAINVLTKHDFVKNLYEDYAVGAALKCAGINVHLSDVVDNKLLEDIEAPSAIPTIEPQLFIKCKITPETPIRIAKCYIVVYNGLGNQLFQIATGIAYALRHDKQLMLIQNSDNVRGYYWDSVLSKFDRLVVSAAAAAKAAAEIAVAEEYKEPDFSYAPIPALSTDDVVLRGYFQSSKYFPELCMNLAHIIELPNHVRYFMELKYGSRLFSDDVVFVHARRGDYCESDYKRQLHGPLTDSYYTAAKAKITQSSPVYILSSDDPKFWKDSSIFTKDESIILDESDIFTLYIMTQCKAFIISNSTFAWWGAVLAGAQTVIAPAVWFGPSGPHNFADIYEPHWILL